MKRKTLKPGLWLLCLLWGWLAGLLWRTGTAAPQGNRRVVRLHVPANTPTQALIQELRAQGLIRSPWAMRLWLRLTGQGIQAGTYDLASNQSLFQVAGQLQKGFVATNRVTIPEGWRIEEMAAHFARLGYFSSREFKQATQRATAQYFPDWLPPEVDTLEGFLFPDTYELPLQGVTASEVVKMMTDRFAAVALPLYREKNQTNLSLVQWVTLASIVEKEAVLDRERPTIAGVFWQRLQRGMKLEADPTVEYGLNIKQTPEAPLTLEQVRTPHPFNTYVNPGLPPHPIAAPGLASLQAALAPPQTDFLFFVARYDGSHIFSRTLEEHEQAVAKIAEQFPGQ
ncbi:MAG: endolytic transglycosylase MltG [Pseudanabaenaceae cyanobacterium SKYGB_i_bin29]|nr:endolytic transglycosylase MltG [Pseudanabaenaceae cyanobacterium SKYG29]MDW8421266.1 endolytic transglycosylase MltG [Pseudanabaenaceae cyanobacterium SKYGB_i_bin29]